MIFLKAITATAAAGILSFFSFNAQAQGFYAKLGGGYNFGIGSSIKYQSTTNPTQGTGASSSSTKFERVNMNYGKGAVFGGALGYMFNNNIGFEIGVNYLAGSKNTVKKEEYNSIGLGFGNLNFPLSGVSGFSLASSTETYTTRSQMVLVQPSLVIAIGLPKFNPYTRIGLIVANGSLKNTHSYSDYYSTNMETEDKFYGGVGFGLQAALGLNFIINDKITIYSEGAFNNLTYAPKKGEVTKFSRNGTDQMHTLNTSQKEITFEDEYYTNNSQDSSSPRTGPKQRYTLNSVGLNAGIKFNF